MRFASASSHRRLCKLTRVLVLFLTPIAMAACRATPAAPAKPIPAQPAELARLIAVPLLIAGAPAPQPNEAELLAAIASRIDKAEAIENRGGNVAPIAHDYVQALKDLQTLVTDRPSAQPLVRSGIDTIKASRANDDLGTLLALLSVGSEISKLSEYSDAFARVHTRVVACRLRLAEVAASSARPESSENTAAAQFSEIQNPSAGQSDTLTLQNICGQRLRNVMVITELTGQYGDRFTNLYYLEQWEPDQVVHAICRSEQPARETVRRVRLVRWRILADERTSKIGELSMTETAR